MFGEPSLNELKIKPRLDDDESVVAITSTTVGDVLRDNVIVAVTNKRIITGIKKGRSVDEEHKEKVNLEIPLKDVQTIRRTGVVIKHHEVVVGNEVFELPSIQNGSDKIIQAIHEQENLGKTDWGEESRTRRGLKQTAAGITGIVGLGVGGLSTLLGLVGIISLAGILLGIGFLFSGMLIIVGSWKIIVWAFETEEEWDRDEPRDVDEQQDLDDPPNGAVESERSSVTGSSDISSTLSRLPATVWPAGVLLGSLLWMSLFALLNHETVFGVVLFTGWIILPISIFMDVRTTARSTEIDFYWWAYTIPAVIPFFASLVGVVWLLRKRQLANFVFRTNETV